jgi:hypothetical protein
LIFKKDSSVRASTLSTEKRERKEHVAKRNNASVIVGIAFTVR